MPKITDAVIRQNPNPKIPLAAVLSFRTDAPVAVDAALISAGHERKISFPMGCDPAAGLPIIGMRAGTAYEVRVQVTDGAGKTETLPPLHYTTPPLPGDLRNFPRFDVIRAETENMEPGFTMLSLRRRMVTRMIWMSKRQRHFLNDWSLLVALDAEGQVVWYYEADHRIGGMHRLQNGNLFFTSMDYRAFEMDFLGNIERVWYASKRPKGPVEGGISIEAESLHHQPHEMPNGNFLAMTANSREFENYLTSETDPDAPRGTKRVVGDRIIEFTAEGGVVWSWDAFDHLDPYRIGYDTFSPFWHVRGFPHHVDWTHGNGVTFDKVNGGMIISLRHQDAFFKVDRDTGEVIWILGTHDGWEKPFSDKLLQPVDPDIRWPFHGHNPRVTDDGTICVYDNAAFQARPFTPAKKPAECFSRGVEYLVDERKGTVEEVWASADDGTEDKVVSWAMGDCHRLPKTNNMLVIDSVCMPEGPELSWQGNITTDDLTWEQWDRNCWNISDFALWGRIREYRRNSNRDVVFEIVVRDPDDLVGWEVYGGLRTPDL
ncbi:MAG: aryl-sulfate sulfotransferase [Deltaproteobacteria bacterium]|nr:aryl-sulfate sulfotransferase [Deltaproteobacteria bacterium]